MKKWIAALLAVLVMVSLLAGCANKTEEKQDNTTKGTEAPKETESKETEPEGTKPEGTEPEGTQGDEKVEAPVLEGVMSYAEYAAAELETEVTVACCVQATQSWWDNKITVYAADEDGAYFLYEMACTQEDAAKLVPGTMIKVTGAKGAWAGEVEIMDATFEFVDTKYTYVAEAIDLTDKMDAEDLIDYQNQLATFKGLTVKEISFKDGGGDDIYVTVTKGDKEYGFCVERYLTDPDTEVYKTASALKAGDVIDVTAYLYWYEGMNPHITEIKAA